MGIHDKFNSGRTFDEFLATVQVNAELWQAMARRAAAPGELVRRVEDTGQRWHLLVIAEDWCGDAVNTLPAIAKLADHTSNADLRVIGRDDNPELVDAHRTGQSRSIPVVIVLDEQFRERGWWAPRPAILQSWVLGPGQALPKRDRYREMRRWYAADRSMTTLREMVELIERAAKAPAAAASAPSRSGQSDHLRGVTTT